MTPEAQRIAIAEACGWTNQQVKAWQELRRLKSEYRSLPKRESFSGWAIADKIEKAEESEHYRGDIPDYLTDLNAMHEAEKTLNDEQAEQYYQEVCKIGQTMEESPIAEYTIHATAAQRAEAFLKTLGLWTN